VGVKYLVKCQKNGNGVAVMNRLNMTKAAICISSYQMFVAVQR
jgi:hypothetical protein